MAKGAFSGVIWGAVVAIAGAGGLSLAYPDFKPTAETEVSQEPVEETVSGSEPAPAETAAPMSAEMAEPKADAAPEEEPVMEMADADTKAPEVAVEPEVDAVTTEEPEPNVDPAMEEAEIVEAEPSESNMAEPDVAEAEVFEPEKVAPDAMEPEMAEPEAEVDVADETPRAEETVPEPDVAESITDEIIAALPKPEGTVGDLAPDVTTGRLPSLSSDDEQTQDAPSAVAPPPFELFASNVEFDREKPRMSIVLIDDGDSELGVEALESFPYPLTFAVDASTPDASKRMQMYRDKGFEVLALVDLPRGATASDVEVAMSAYIAAVPEAVGILEGVETGVQTSREMADQLTQIILDSGHGMLLQKSGLNTARKLAEREGIPAATVFRDFDGNGQSASVMRRFLDQAAFRAAQEGGVVMMGRLQAETISALLIWGLADRASRVALVPVSAVLKQDAADEG